MCFVLHAPLLESLSLISSASSSLHVPKTLNIKWLMLDFVDDRAEVLGNFQTNVFCDDSLFPNFCIVSQQVTHVHLTLKCTLHQSIDFLNLPNLSHLFVCIISVPGTINAPHIQVVQLLLGDTH